MFFGHCFSNPGRYFRFSLKIDIGSRRDEGAQKFGRSAKVLVMKSLGALS